MSYEIFKKFAQHHEVSYPITNELFCATISCGDCILYNSINRNCHEITKNPKILTQYYEKLKRKNPEYLV